MLTYGNEREVQQGEEWNLDILISQSDTEYIPFIVSSERQNPMWAITVASTKYEKNERYVATWWQDLVQGEGFTLESSETTGLRTIPLPRFYQTVPEYIGELSPNTPLTRQPNPNTDDGFDPPMHALYQFTKQQDTVDPVLGHKPYYYAYFTHEDPYKARYDYECRIRMQFRSTETAQWRSQNYMYQITLVDTVSMADYIQQARDEYPQLEWKEWVQRDDTNWIKPVREPWETNEEYETKLEVSWVEFRNNWIMENVEELYTFIKNRIPSWFQPDIDIDAPVGQIDVPQIILPPTKLQVNNNLRRII